MKDDKKCCGSLPLKAMALMSLLGGVVVSLCFLVVTSWPLPVSIAPYFGPEGGFVWGAVVGAISGLILGFLTDDSHFTDPA